MTTRQRSGLALMLFVATIGQTTYWPMIAIAIIGLVLLIIDDTKEIK